MIIGFVITTSSLSSISSISFAAKSKLETVRLWSKERSSYIGLELSHKPNYQVFYLHKPKKLVVDLHDTVLDTSLSRLKLSTYIKRVRYTQQKNSTLRLVFDLNQPAQVSTRWQEHRRRLQLVLSEHNKKTIDKPVLWRSARVLIDPGHGGHDPGAVSQNHIYEKHITLNVAKQLMAYLNKLPGVQASLTRDSDHFLGLRQRLAKARHMGADLFISLHADHFKNNRAKGGSVFILSKEGASSEAVKLLAERENAALIGGNVSLKKTKKNVAEVLLDLSQSATLKQSHQFAHVILNTLKGSIPLHYKTVQRADFAVLKAPDVPSLLVELGFISHPGEAKKLMQASYQKRLVTALAKGVVSYLEQYPPQKTWFSHHHRYHKVSSGDSLSKIALRFKSSLSALRQANHLKSDHIQVGQMLLVPISAQA